MIESIATELYLAAGSACGTKTGILPSLYDFLGCKDGVPEIKSLEDTVIILGNIIRILIAISGSIAVIALLVSSVYYITAMGNPQQVKKAKDIIVYVIMGLVLIIMAYAIITYIASAF